MYALGHSYTPTSTDRDAEYKMRLPALVTLVVPVSFLGRTAPGPGLGLACRARRLAPAGPGGCCLQAGLVQVLHLEIP